MFGLREQAEADEDCQAAYDLALAAFSVYDHLRGQSFLRSEETLLAELKNYWQTGRQPQKRTNKSGSCWYALISLPS